MAQFNTLNIKSINKETNKAVTLSFVVPSHLASQYTFIAGQYITLKTTVNGEEIRRDYSLCSSPKSGELKVGIKAIENGLFSNYANSNLEAGDTLEVSTPQGRFKFEPNTTKTRSIAAFAAGSGITPVLSIAKSILEEEPNSKFVLVYGNKNIAETMFLQELLDLHHKYKERFHIQFLYSQSEESNAIFGRIEESTVNLIVKNKFKHVAFDSFYLCGPEGMIYTVTDVLKSYDIAEDKIYFELFKAAKNTAKNDVSATGETQITVIVDDEEETFSMSQKNTILEAAIEKDLDAPYSCQGGICSSCIARVKEGTAEMRQNSILTDAEVAEGLIITCQAHPTSTTIIVDYDDV
ncbi:2Fe-2S iron-sulfur cluster-binding protein [Aurantibacter sp.]|uniref:2Fe-2S iron-sulfur cluster-binding protein n=1 Tax=Aurantibacter sp. TaxID=2807103 RepID=UPI0035C79EFB